MGLLAAVGVLWPLPSGLVSGPCSSCHTPAADVVIFYLMDVFHVVYKVICAISLVLRCYTNELSYLSYQVEGAEPEEAIHVKVLRAGCEPGSIMQAKLALP